MTVRLPFTDYCLIKELADARGTSLNSVVSEAVAQYARKLKREHVIAEIQSFQQRLQRRCGQPGTDSVGLLRELRDGADR
jgi:hypothetical protein